MQLVGVKKTLPFSGLFMNKVIIFCGYRTKARAGQGRNPKNICPSLANSPKSTTGIIKVTEFGSKILSFATLCHNWLEGGCNCATEMNTSWRCHLDFWMLSEISTNQTNFSNMTLVMEYHFRIYKSKQMSHVVQVNLCQKLLFLHQLTHNMTTDCSLNYEFST